MDKILPLKLVETSGGPHEAGYQQGQQLKPMIHRLLKDEFYDYFARDGLSRESLLNYAGKHVPYIEEYSPASFETIKGIGEGAEISIEEAVLIQMHEEVKFHSEAFPLRKTEGHCTLFGCNGSATVQEETYIGQNWDYPAELFWNGEVAFLLHERRSDGPNILAYNAPGFLAWAGMNANGISLCWSSVPAKNMRVGVPTYLIVKEILRAKNIGEALGAIVTARRAGCCNYLIADENGEIYNVESTPDEVELTYCEGVLGHANHYLKCECENNIASFVKRKKGVMPNLSSVVRQNRIDRLLHESSGSIDLESCKSFLTDHVNFPYSICSHQDPEKANITYDSWVMVPRKREWWIARYPACKTGYKRYVVS